MNQTIIQAIRDKKLLEIRYHGYSRLVEPHVYGVSTKGRDALRCYQIAGGSVSGSPADWKLLSLDEMSSMSMSEKAFAGPRFDYVRADKAMMRIYAQL